jgi:hypothetical protein
VQSELEGTTDAIALYKALGAGWQDIYPDDKPEQPNKPRHPTAAPPS